MALAVVSSQRNFDAMVRQDYAPLFQRAGLSIQDFTFEEGYNHSFEKVQGAAGRYLFMPAVSYVETKKIAFFPGLDLFDKEAFGWIFQHELGHIKDNNSTHNPLLYDRFCAEIKSWIMKAAWIAMVIANLGIWGCLSNLYILASTCVISAIILMRLYQVFYFSRSIEDTPSMKEIFDKEVETKADHFANEEASAGELIGGWRYFKALQKIWPTSDGGKTHPHPETRLQSIKQALKSRYNLEIDEAAQSSKIDDLSVWLRFQQEEITYPLQNLQPSFDFNRHVRRKYADCFAKAKFDILKFTFEQESRSECFRELGSVKGKRIFNPGTAQLKEKIIIFLPSFCLYHPEEFSWFLMHELARFELAFPIKQTTQIQIEPRYSPQRKFWIMTAALTAFVFESLVIKAWLGGTFLSLGVIMISIFALRWLYNHVQRSVTRSEKSVLEREDRRKEYSQNQQREQQADDFANSHADVEMLLGGWRYFKALSEAFPELDSGASLRRPPKERMEAIEKALATRGASVHENAERSRISHLKIWLKQHHS